MGGSGGFAMLLSRMLVVALSLTCAGAGCDCGRDCNECQPGEEKHCTCLGDKVGLKRCDMFSCWGWCECGCGSHADCPRGSWCEFGECVRLPCERDGDCPPEFLCNEHQCWLYDCVHDWHCGVDFICRDHVCEYACDSDSECAQGETCYTPLRECFGGEPCNNDGDCAQPVPDVYWVRCREVGGNCYTRFPSCTRETLAENCPVGMVCTAGLCAPKPLFCNDDESCFPWERCNRVTGECFEVETEPDAEAGAEADAEITED